MKEKDTKRKDVEIIEKLMNSGNIEEFEMFDEEGNAIAMQQIGIVEYNGKKYAILRDSDGEEIDEDDEIEVTVYEIDATDEDTLTQVDNEELAEAVLEKFEEDMAD